jgi:hypothetical protein
MNKFLKENSMNKRSLSFWFAVLLATAFVFTGCELEPEPDELARVELIGYDYLVTTLDELEAVLIRPEYSRIAFQGDSSGTYIAVDFEISPGKTVGIFSPVTVGGTAKLTIAGVVNVEVSGYLMAEGEIEGPVNVRVGGELETDDLVKIKNLAAVRITGGTLAYTGMLSDGVTVESLFGNISHGTLLLSPDTTAFLKASDIVKAAKDGGVFTGKRLIATAGFIETEAIELTIPAGMDITLSAGLENITNFIVDGKATISAASTSTGNVVVNGELVISGAPLTIATGRTLIVKGTLLLSDATSAVELPANTSLAVYATGKLLGGAVPIISGINLTVAASSDTDIATKATVTVTGGIYIVASTTETTAVRTIIIGNVSWTTTANTAVDALAAVDAGLVRTGTLKAGINTTLTINGSD